MTTIDESPVIDNQVMSLDDDDETFAIRHSSGQEDIVLSKKLLPISKMIEAGISGSSDNLFPIDQKEVSIVHMNMVVQYMNLCKDFNQNRDVIAPKELVSTDLMLYKNENLPAEIIDFVNDIYVSYGKLNMYDLINVCNYLDIRGLMLLLCSCLATKVKGKTMTEVLSILDPMVDMV